MDLLSLSGLFAPRESESPTQQRSGFFFSSILVLMRISVYNQLC
nr:MAG TPA: hypothetical protein [Caudoviricetes sp.]